MKAGARGKAGRRGPAKRGKAAGGAEAPNPAARPGAARRDAAGRVHLQVQRDPATGEEHFRLTGPVFEASWQNDLVAGAVNTARGMLGAQPTQAATVALARSVMAATSRLAEGLLARAPSGTVACKAGCDHCCYQSVGVTPPEALAIRDHVVRTLPAEPLRRLAARAADLAQRRQGLSAAERFSPDHPCLFLDEKAGRCSIYDVRPLSCRGMNSLDAGECEQRLRDEAARAEFVATGTGGHTYQEPIQAFHAVSAGVQLALSELYGLDMRPLELTAAMHLLLDGPPSSREDWLQGGAAFESALSRPT